MLYEVITPFRAHPTLDEDLRRFLAAIQEILDFRITSYNVCYTKLLRFLHPSPASGDPGSWSSLPPVPEKRTEAAAALLDGTIYLIGGFTPKGISSRVLAFHPETGTWEDKSPLPRPLHHTTATVAGGRLYVIGGFYTGRWSPVAATYEYHPEKNEWTEKAAMPTARGALAAEVIDGKIPASYNFV